MTVIARIRSQSGKAAGIVPILLAVAILHVAGCSEGYNPTWWKNGFLDPTQVGDYESQISSEIRDNVSLFENPSGVEDAEQPSPEDLQPLYVAQPIGPGDMVGVSIYELQQFGATTSLQARVESTGYATLPVLGRVYVQGYTARELEQALKDILAERQILPKADVQINVLASQASQVTLTGQGIVRPGIYMLPRPDYRLHELLAAAGGISPIIDKIYVFRRVVPPEGSEVPLDELPPDSQPASRPVDELDGMMPRLMMSDTSSSRTSSLGDPPQPTTSEPEIDELSILEGRATSKPVKPAKPVESVPVWDPERGEWILEGDGEPEPATDAEQPMEELAAPVAEEPASQAAPAQDATRGVPTTIPAEDGLESSPWGPESELASSVRIIEIPRQALMNGDPSVNIVLRPYDVVQIPAGDIGEYYLGGNIARPGAYSLTGRKLTVKQAIIAAGGFNALAWPGRAQLIRKISDNEEQSIQLDLDAIFAMKAPDFYVKPNDIIQVGTTPLSPFLAVVRNAFRFTYGFGFVYDRNFGDQDTYTAEIQRKNYESQQRALKGLPP